MRPVRLRPWEAVGAGSEGGVDGLPAAEPPTLDAGTELPGVDGPAAAQLERSTAATPRPNRGILVASPVTFQG